MSLAEAKAIESTISVIDEMAERDREGLKRLTGWAQRFSPIVALEESAVPSSLLIDVTGCASCLGGEEKLLNQAYQGLVNMGYQARIALADTVGAAWALSHYGETSLIHLLGESSEKLSLLPLAALRLSSENMSRLKKVGIERIGQLMALPSSSLPVRFGSEVLLRLDQAFGRVPETLAAYRPVSKVAFRRVLEYPAESTQILHRLFRELLDEVTRELQQRSRGVRKLSCQLKLIDADSVSVELELLRPSADTNRLFGMLCIKMESIKLNGAVSEVMFRVTADEAINDEQMDLFDNETILRSKEWLALTEALSLRFGRERVLVPRLVADPLPELAYRRVPAVSCETIKDEEVDEKSLRHRPLCLWQKPMPLEVLTLTPPGIPQLLRAQSSNWKVAHVSGPERLESGWWRGSDVARDYYMVEIENGSRLWIFHRLTDGQWFWHGCFD
jgi:protein ImuB